MVPARLAGAFALALLSAASCSRDPGGGPPPDAACAPDPLVGEEQAVGVPVTGAAADSQLQVAAARGADGWLLVWQDDRRDEGGDIYGARLGDDGTLRDPYAFPITIVGGTQEAPRVAFGGGVYLVVWIDYGYFGNEVRAARVSPTGGVLDPAGIGIAAGNSPDVSFDGNNFVVVYTGDGGQDGDILAARVTPAGTLLDPNGVLVCAAPGPQALPSVVAGAPGALLVSWIDGSGASLDLRAGRIGADLQPRDGDGLLIATAVVDNPVRLAYDGQRYWAAWQDDGDDLLARRIAADGTLPDAQPLAIAGGPGIQGGPDLDYDGAHVVVAWHHQTDPMDRAAFDIHALRLALDGTPLDAQPIVVSAAPGQQARPAVASRGGATLIAWDGDSDEPWDIYATRLDAQGTVAHPGGERVTASADSQSHPEVAASGAGQLLLYLDRRRDAQEQVLAQRLDARGSTPAGPPLPLTPDGSINAEPALAPGDPALVSFMRWSLPSRLWEIVVMRLGAQGAPLDPDGILVVGQPDFQLRPAQASDGERALVVWEDERPEREYGTVYGARLTRDGRLLDPGGFLIADGQQPEVEPAVAFGAGVYLVAWERLDAPNYSRGALIEIALISPEGTVLSRSALGSPDERRDKTTPQVAFDGANFLVVWELHLHTGWNISATRVTPAGAVLDPQGIAITNGTVEESLIRPSVVWAGSSYVIGWEDEYLTGVSVRRLGADGRLLDAAPLPVSAGGLGQRALSLGRAPDGSVTAAYQRFDAALGSWRVFHRRLDFGVSCLE